MKSRITFILSIAFCLLLGSKSFAQNSDLPMLPYQGKYYVVSSTMSGFTALVLNENEVKALYKKKQVGIFEYTGYNENSETYLFTQKKRMGREVQKDAAGNLIVIDVNFSEGTNGNITLNIHQENNGKDITLIINKNKSVNQNSGVHKKTLKSSASSIKK